MNQCLAQDNIIYIETMIKLFSKNYIVHIYHSNDQNLISFFDKCLVSINISYMPQIKLNVKLNCAHHENYINSIKNTDESINRIEYIEEFLNFNPSKIKSEMDLKLFIESAVQFALELKDDNLLNKIINKYAN